MFNWEIHYESIQKIAKKLAGGRSHWEDMAQEAALKLQDLSSQVRKDFDLEPEDFRRKVLHVARNAMLDYMRKMNRAKRRVTKECLFDDELSNPLASEARTQFEALSEKYALRELEKMLSGIEQAILKEVVSPSPEYMAFCAKRRRVMQCTQAAFGKKRRIQHSRTDQSLAEFLKVGSWRLKAAMDRIKIKAERVNFSF